MTPAAGAGGCIVSPLRANAHSSHGGLPLPLCGDGLSRPGQTEQRHVVVDAFEIAWPHAVGFMPDADVAVVCDRAIERRPCRAMRSLCVLGVTIQIVERAPILQCDRGVADPRVKAEETQVAVLTQFAKHPRHCPRDREPLMDLPNAID